MPWFAILRNYLNTTSLVSFAASPTVVRPPTDQRIAQAGETITIECEAIGVPTPLIVWRLNWGHVGKPPRVSSTSQNGRGVLTITQVRIKTYTFTVHGSFYAFGSQYKPL